jgi:hypothetical protein
MQMSVTTEASGATAIHSFHVDISDEALEDLRRRVAAVRWPSRELVTDRSQGVQLATLQELTRYWASDYDWRRCEAKLHALPQFKTVIDGEEIHFIHVKSPHDGALPPSRTRSAAALAPSRLHHVPGRDLSGFAQLG